MSPEIRHEQRSAPLPSGEVSLLIARQVDPGHEAAFEEWANGLFSVAARFPGHLGHGLFRPASPGEPWFLVHRFRDNDAYEHWHASGERTTWFARADGHHREIDRRWLTGLEGWFPVPGADTRQAPSQGKMTLTAFLGIFPVSLLAGTVLQPAMAGLPLVVRTGIIAALFSTLMSYAVMPVLTRLLRRWLFPSTGRSVPFGGPGRRAMTAGRRSRRGSEFAGSAVPVEEGPHLRGERSGEA
ncbi:antibiotic biosynthesis monooxygenase [Streptomyces albipurpureus]|uniref:Antibiotic biosynthesis monooxygenase n=1 Tax=Streptomyces albipurpureus TaxID=2897419 RepID=A0ABT0UMS9_9ACTN|nr:antibiotic biosynthesis monooxygenase [Streptomyces sp. CWNU-1]MCM2389760.1 antibiotic biosynthesis monooxygenase [Streptomyces sp. CWNU-1]